MTEKEIKSTQDSILEEVSSLPDEVREEVVAELFQQEVRVHRGPIPSPEEMAAYNSISPEIVHYILSEAEANGKHIRECEKSDVNGQISFNMRGQSYAFIVTLGSIVLCGLTIIFMDGVAGDVLSFVFGAAGITPIITRFMENMRGSYKKNRD